MRYIGLISWWIHVLVVRRRRYDAGPNNPGIKIIIGELEYVPMVRQLNFYGTWEHAGNVHSDAETMDDGYVQPIGMQPLFHSIINPPSLRPNNRWQYNFADQAVPTDMIPKHPKDISRKYRDQHVIPVGMASLQL